MRFAILLLPVLALPHPASSQQDAPLRALRAAYPLVTWETASVHGDFDCDSVPGDARIGRYRGHLFVGLYFAGRKQVDILEFAVSAAVQQAICAEPATLTTESLDFDPSAAGVGPLPGFHRSVSCKGLRLAGGECDPVHIYWNHDQRQITWWRL